MIAKNALDLSQPRFLGCPEVEHVAFPTEGSSAMIEVLRLPAELEAVHAVGW
jgi:hypothetical protein